MRTVISILALLLLLGVAAGMSINPSTDILSKNVDGEYIKIFGPGGFFYADGQFPNPVAIVDGIAMIGGRR